MQVALEIFPADIDQQVWPPAWPVSINRGRKARKHARRQIHAKLELIILRIRSRPYCLLRATISSSEHLQHRMNSSLQWDDPSERSLRILIRSNKKPISQFPDSTDAIYDDENSPLIGRYWLLQRFRAP